MTGPSTGATRRPHRPHGHPLEREAALAAIDAEAMPQLPQWKDALGQARAAKERIRTIREGLDAGTLTLRGLLTDDPAHPAPDELRAQAERIPVDQLLRWTPGIGRVLSTSILTAIDLQPTDRAAALGPDARRRVLAAADTLAMTGNVRRSA